MTRPFSITCYRYDVGIFTAYGARIKSAKTTYPNPPRALHNLPARRDPRFIDKIFYDVVIYTSPDLTQSFACYRSKDLNQAKIFLDNFIYLSTRGYRYIDLGRIPDKPIRPCPPPPPKPGPYVPPYDPYKPWFYKNDEFDAHVPDSEIDPRYINDPRKNPWFDTFENLTRESRYAGEPPIPHNSESFPPVNDADVDVDVDCAKVPKYDGDIVRFEPVKDNCPPPWINPDFPPFDPHKHYRPEPPCPPYDPPYEPHHHHHHPCPPPPPPRPCPPVPPYYPPIHPPIRDRICIYYGNGGFAMGESVTSNIKELAPNALRTMISKNFHSTYSNMNPRDTIVVKKNVLDCILPEMVFKTNMDIAGEWSFFMIPDKFYKLVENFNWYYKEDVYDGTWYELDKSIPQTTFTIQDNGIRYFVNAVRLNGRYDMRFAKTGRDFNNEPEPSEPDADNRELDIDMKFVTTINIKDLIANGYVVTIEDLSVTNQVIRTLSDFIHDEIAWQAIENHIYELKIYAKTDIDRETPLVTTWFIAIPDASFKHGFCTWVFAPSDQHKEYDASVPISEQFIRVIETETPSANDRLIIVPPTV